MDFRPGRKTVILWQIRAGAAFFALALLFFALSAVSRYFGFAAAATVLSGFAVAFWYVPAYFGGYTVRVGKTAVTVTRGVIIRTARIMPYKRMVFASGYSTPLARLFGLRGVRLRAARADVRIPEMDASAADMLIFGLGEVDLP